MSASFRASLLWLLHTAACAAPQSSDADKAQFEVEWSGSGGGRLEGAATARWCADRRLLEISLLQGDTGIAVALYPNDSLRPGPYPVVDPAKAQSRAPAAGVAVRWLTQTIVQGFQGESGRVTLERSPPGRLSGQVGARARSVVDTQRIRLAGTFRNLTVVQDTIGCAPDDEDTDSEDIAEDTIGLD